MKKTLIINIGNTIIHFEEDAFEALKAYLNGIKIHFATTADNFEIVTDIENRIAELLNELLAAQQKQVVNLQDTQLVMDRMGSVSDFEQETQEDVAPKNESYNSKRLFRDTDNMVVAGVCAGLSHYINIETRLLRLIALISVFLGGAGILAYIILWIVMPPALSRVEKMAMNGESPDLQGFKRNFEEELAAFKGSMSNASAHLEPYVKHTGNFITDAAKTIGHFIEGTAKVFFKIIALLIIIMGICIMLSLIILVAVVAGMGDADFFNYFPFSIINNGYQDSMVLAAFITLFVPILALVLFSIRVAFNKRAINKTLSFALLTIWLCGVAFTAFYTTKITSEFKEYAELTQTSPIQSFPKYTLTLDKAMLFNNQDSMQYKLTYKNMDGLVVLDDDDNDHPFKWPRNVRIVVEKAEANSPTLSRFYHANGKTFKAALDNAQNIDYKFVQQNDVLTFSPRLMLKKTANWRAQEVKLILKVPVGTVLRINSNMYKYLEFYNWDCRDDNTEYMDWVMTEEEGLRCATDNKGIR